MGRGRNGAFNQGGNNKTGGFQLPKEDRILFPICKKRTPNQTIIALPEEALKALGQMNPRDVVNILVNN